MNTSSWTSDSPHAYPIVPILQTDANISEYSSDSPTTKKQANKQTNTPIKKRQKTRHPRFFFMAKQLSTEGQLIPHCGYNSMSR